jgi:hypothetical protein
MGRSAKQICCVRARGQRRRSSHSGRPLSNLIEHQGPQHLDPKLVPQVHLYRSRPSYYIVTSYPTYVHLSDLTDGRPRRSTRVPLRYVRHVPFTYRPHRARPVAYHTPPVASSPRHVPTASPPLMTLPSLPPPAPGQAPGRPQSSTRCPRRALTLGHGLQVRPRPRIAWITTRPPGSRKPNLGCTFGRAGRIAASLPVAVQVFPYPYCVTYRPATIARPFLPRARLSPTQYFLSRTRTSTSSPAFKFDVAPRARRSDAQR